MKTLVAFLVIAAAAFADEPKTLQSGDGTGNFPIYVLGDGWRQEDMGLYEASVDKMLGDQLWNVEPYTYFKHIFTIKRYNVVSSRKGVQIFEPPLSMGDEEERKRIKEVPTALNVTFQKVTDDPNLDAAIPKIDGIIGGNKDGIAIVLLNTNIQMAVSKYDKGRFYIALPADAKVDASGILAHEMGHAFFGLGDEYCSDRTYKTEPPNLTKNPNPKEAKWKHIIESAKACNPLPGGTPGLGGYYHAYDGCRMNQAPYTGGFCRVCLEGMTQNASEVYTPIAKKNPNDSWITVHPFSDITFSVTLRGPSHEYAMVWLLNGRKLGRGTINGMTSTITLSWYNLFPAYNKVQFMVEDRRNVVSPDLKSVGKAPQTAEWGLFSLMPPQPVPLVQKAVSWFD